MAKESSFLKKAWNAVADSLRLYPRNGTVERLSFGELMDHPRIIELLEQMKPLMSSPHGDLLTLDKDTGNFYLKSAIRKKGMEKAKPLGRIDVRDEKDLFDFASRMAMMKKVFGDASDDNPIVWNMEKGTVYAQNNPSVIRGNVRSAQEVKPAPKPGKTRRF